MNFRRRCFATALATVGALGIAGAVAAPPLGAQDPAGPLALTIPVSARAAALGNAWVAGRDEYVIFHNPALVNTPAAPFGVSIGSFAHNGFSLAAAAGFTVGPANVGWGVHLVNFSTPRSNAAYPYSPSDVLGSGEADISSLVAVAAASILHKGFRIGVAAKYAQDIVPMEASTSSLLVVPTRGAAVLADVGTSHALWTGIAALSLQNMGAPYTVGSRTVSVPTQLSLGWTKNQIAGPFDVGYATQATLRRGGWVGAGGGVDVGWSWIEGYTVNGRIGARRTETDDERPFSLGAAVNADRLNVEWGLGFFTESRMAHRITVRWR